MASSSTPGASAPGSTTRCSTSSDRCSSRSFARDAAVRPADSGGGAAAAIPETKTTTWVEPVHVCEVRFREWTPDGVLRHAAVPAHAARQGSARLRASGRRPCTGKRRAMPAADRESNEPGRAAAEVAAAGREDVQLLESEEGLLAGGRIHEGRSHRVLPRDLAVDVCRICCNRPLVMTRFPDGIDGKSFYQKDAPEFAPEWIRDDPDLERGHAARHPLLRLRRRRVAALRRQPRLDSDAHLEQPSRIARAAGLVRDRSRSEGGAVLRRRFVRAIVFRALMRGRSVCRAT